MDVDRQCKYRAPDGRSRDLVDDDQIHNGVVDLHNVERARGAVFLDDRSEHSARRGGALAAQHRLAGIHAFYTQPDSSPMWRRQACPAAFRAYSVHECPNAWPLGTQIECLDLRLHQFVDPRVNLTVPFGPARLFRQEGGQPALGLEAGSPAKYRAAINSEFPGGLSQREALIGGRVG